MSEEAYFFSSESSPGERHKLTQAWEDTRRWLCSCKGFGHHGYCWHSSILEQLICQTQPLKEGTLKKLRPVPGEQVTLGDLGL